MCSARTSGSGGTALTVASTMGQPAIVEALLDKGADINHRDDNPLPLCMRRCGTRITARSKGHDRSKSDRWRSIRQDTWWTTELT
jgi:ankyrin repeat protein